MYRTVSRLCVSSYHCLPTALTSPQSLPTFYRPSVWYISQLVLVPTTVFPIGIFTFKTFLMSPPLPAHMTYSFMSKALPLNSLQFFHSVSFLSALFNILNCNYAVSVIRRVNVMCIGHWWKDTAGKNRSTHRKIHCPFVDHQCHMDWPGSEPMAPQWHNGD